MTLSKACSQYGADMGRPSDVFPAELDGEVRALELFLEDGAYDSGGAYWGAGNPIYRLTAEAEGQVWTRYMRFPTFRHVRQYVENKYPGTKLVKDRGPDSLDEFVQHYAESALFTSTDENDKPLDEGDYELAEETLALFRKECEEFLKLADPIAGDIRDAMLAHDFWMTRSGTGIDFEDRDYPKAVAKKLVAIAKKFDEQTLYVGDDGKVYAL